MLSLSKKDTNLITEIANLVLKYTFALSTTTCRALVSTLIHMNENLARQMYNYAEGIGIYPAVKVNIINFIYKLNSKKRNSHQFIKNNFLI